MSLVIPPLPGNNFAVKSQTVSENLLQTEMRLIIEALYGPPVRRLPGLDIGRAYRGTDSEFRYGGDVVDVFHYGGGYTSLAVVDITGHGMPAAGNAGLAKHALRAYASRGLDAGDCVRALNRLCIENSAFEGDEEFFATLFFAILPPDRSSMQFVSAGHDTAYVITAAGAHALEATGPIIGLMDDDANFDSDVVALPLGSVIAAVTDGFTEARDPTGQFLGRQALADIILQNQSLVAEQQAEAITQYAFDFSETLLRDDIAALIVKITA